MLKAPGGEGGGLGLASVSDFANYFTAHDNRYELEIQDKILDKAEGGKYKEDALVRGRLRTTWKLAKAEFDKALSRVSDDRADTDWDGPLPPEDEKERADEFAAAYDNFSFSSDQMPMRPLVCRAVREFKSSDRHVSLTDTKRIRSEAQLKPANPATTTALGRTRPW